jgi:hypothetical protein
MAQLQARRTLRTHENRWHGAWSSGHTSPMLHDTPIAKLNSAGEVGPPDADACGVWLLDQATVRRPPLQDECPVLYDQERQASVVMLGNGESPLAVESLGGSPTKKGDIEKGEDQKDRWRP